MHCLKNYNEKYMMYRVEHCILSDSGITLRRKLYYGINNIYSSVIRITQFRNLYYKITLCIKLYSNLGNYLKYIIDPFSINCYLKLK